MIDGINLCPSQGERELIKSINETTLSMRQLIRTWRARPCIP
jgi:hypothetical protein